MIDTSTGSININDIVLSPKLTTDDFKNSTLYKGGSLERMYAIKEPKNISGKSFIVSVYFVNGYLKEIQLYLVEDKESSSDDWSKNTEKDKKKVQDEWLKSLLGKGQYNYSWGHIESVYDPKGGFSLIIIRYK